MSERKPWHRRKGETRKAFGYFRAYLEMGHTRSLAKVAKQFDKQASYRRQLAKWSSKHDWVDRTTAWDEEQARRALQKRMQAVEDSFDVLADNAKRSAAVLAGIVAGVVKVDDSDATPEVRRKAAVDILSMLGVKAPDELVLVEEPTWEDKLRSLRNEQESDEAGTEE